MEPIRIYVSDHPALVTLLVYPVLVAILTLIFAPRDLDDPSRKMSVRAEALWMILAGAGVDAPKMVDGIVAAALGRTPKDRAAGLRAMAAAMIIDLPKIAAGAVQFVTGKRSNATPKPPSVPPLAILLLVTILALGACHERPACAPEQLATIEAAYISEALATCRGRMVSNCIELEGIRAKYKALREEWVSCR